MVRLIDDKMRGSILEVDHADFWEDMNLIMKSSVPYIRVAGHPLTGKTIEARDGREVTIQEVALQYCEGYYIAALFVDKEESHGILYYGNISSTYLPIIRAIDKDQKYYNIP